MQIKNDSVMQEPCNFENITLSVTSDNHLMILLQAAEGYCEDQVAFNKWNQPNKTRTLGMC